MTTKPVDNESDEYLVDYEVRDRIAYIALNRPRKHNALTDEGVVKLREAFYRLDADDSADVGILFGRGKSFCSGADLKARLLDSAGSDESGSPAVMRRESEHAAIFDTANWKPLIGALHGYVLGHAFGTALAMDVTVATPDAHLQVTETAFGIPMGGLWASIAFATGQSSFATEMVLTGRVCSGAEAVERGLLTKLAADGDHLAAATELARQVLAHPQHGVRELVRIRRMKVAENSQWSRSVTSGYRFTDNATLGETVTAKLNRPRS